MSIDILVTGGNGLLGRAVQMERPDATFVSRQQADLTDPIQVKRLFEKFRPQRVLHLAGKVGGVKYNAKHNADLFSSNILINNNVLEAAKNFGIKRLVSVISSCAFPFYSNRPSIESDLFEGVPFEGNLGYGYSKRMLGLQTRLLNQQYGCDFSTITPVTMYGPYDNFDLEQGHVIGALISKCQNAQKNKTALEVWGSGSAFRQFVFVRDVAKILQSELENFRDDETIIVTPGEGITIRQLAFEIADIMGFKGSVHFNTERPEGQQVKVLQSKRFSNRFSLFSFTPLKEGLEKTISWFLRNSDTQENLLRSTEKIIC